MTSNVQNQFFGFFISAATPPILEISIRVHIPKLDLRIGKDLQVCVSQDHQYWSCYSGTSVFFGRPKWVFRGKSLLNMVRCIQVGYHFDTHTTADNSQPTNMDKGGWGLSGWPPKICKIRLWWIAPPTAVMHTVSIAVTMPTDMWWMLQAWNYRKRTYIDLRWPKNLFSHISEPNFVDELHHQ